MRISLRKTWDAEYELFETGQGSKPGDDSGSVRHGSNARSRTGAPSRAGWRYRGQHVTTRPPIPPFVPPSGSEVC